MYWILLIIIFAALAVIGVVISRKIPQLRVIDVNSIPRERERKVKEKLILSKFHRRGGVKLRKIAKALTGFVKFVSRPCRRVVQRLYRLEQYYQKLKRSAQEGTRAYSSDVIKSRLEEAEALIKQDEFIPAEKIFIDIISHNPKSIEGYEALGNMYLRGNQLEQARETLQFALRLSPMDASVNVSLAELELKLDEPKKALAYLRKAVEKRPKNPRYLDYYIDVALKVGSLKDARSGIKSLNEVNPENKKIEEFEERFAKKKDEYINRANSQSLDPSQEDFCGDP